jgi:hypothetical protein
MSFSFQEEKITVTNMKSLYVLAIVAQVMARIDYNPECEKVLRYAA